MKKTLVVLALLCLLVGCGGAQPTQNAQSGGNEQKAAPAKKDFTVKLVENPWTGSRVNVAVAKNMLEKQLGYKVETITIGENAQWPALSKGDAHVSLEVWPSGHVEKIADYIEKQKVIENGGPLGPVGKIGWYVPSYVIKDHPELASWEGFKKAENAKLFATAETGDQGQFLAGDPSWVQYDDQIIKNLGLNLKIVSTGSEQAILAALDGAYNRKAPVLFYFYTPHAAFQRYELSEVKLPDYNQACYDKKDVGGIACDYPKDELFKIFWTGLAKEAPDAYNLLKKMNYTTKDQIGMIVAVDSDKKSPDEAAQAWVTANEAVWKKWLP